MQQVNFEELVIKSKKNNQNRLTIRYYYLWCLQKLASKNIIVWDTEKTNSDFLYEIENQAIKIKFEYISNIYNTIWYGEYKVSETQHNQSIKAFQQFLQAI